MVEICPRPTHTEAFIHMSKVFQMTLAALYRHQHLRKRFALANIPFTLQWLTFQYRACISQNQVLCLQMKHTEGVSSYL